MGTSTVSILKNNGTNRPPSSNTTPLPTTPITKELLGYLREIYPDRVPTVAMSEREIWMEVGKISVVRHLEDIYKMQNDIDSEN